MSAQIDGEAPAFPVPLLPGETWIGPGSPLGMTLRDWFAGQALPQVFCAFSKDVQAELEEVAGSNLNPENDGCSLRSWMTDAHDSEWAEGIANACYNIADAMLKARKGGK